MMNRVTKYRLPFLLYLSITIADLFAFKPEICKPIKYWLLFWEFSS